MCPPLTFFDPRNLSLLTWNYSGGGVKVSGGGRPVRLGAAAGGAHGGGKSGGVSGERESSGEGEIGNSAAGLPRQGIWRRAEAPGSTPGKPSKAGRASSRAMEMVSGGGALAGRVRRGVGGVAKANV
ncbi:hypothetical protein NL676_030295 [Syzygium grande]|nr:hypothetical protein NL676_030295 [Syzygium grande]